MRHFLGNEGKILKFYIFWVRFLSRGKRDMPRQKDSLFLFRDPLQYMKKGGRKYGAVAAVVSGEAGRKND